MEENKWSIRTEEFDGLSTLELYQILQMRSAIFVVEQDCVYQDLDGLDPSACHLLLELDANKKEKKLAGYSRVLPPGLEYNGYSSFGRLVVPMELRGRGYGRLLAEKSLDLCRKKFPGTPVKIMAQSYLTKFYADLGFEKVGPDYLEDGIEHCDMIAQSG
ncbi:MAG: GNAT family N-acetyltransferase [Saprospirales bacterium]|nr:MAG: GNAT family N-acetyltransferase [Saprospirales bacterium]